VSVADDFYSIWDQQKAPQAVANGATITVNVPAGGHPYAIKALEDEAVEVANAREGTRNDTLNTAAFRMGRHVGAGTIDAQLVRNTLADAARMAGLPQHEIDTVLRDDDNAGINQGALSPRTPSELETPDVTILSDPVEGEQHPVEKHLPLIDWHDLWASDDTEEWIIEPLLPARRAVALYSAPKVGKSLLMLELAVGIARATEVLGVTPDRPRRVLYVDFENDPRGDVRTRLDAMDVGPNDLADLCYLSFPSLAKLDTEMGGLQLVAAAQHYECEVVVIDTVSRAVGGEENANDTWLAFYRNTGLILKSLGIACIRLDHTGKDRAKGMRGGSAKYGDVDAVWKLEMNGDNTLLLECTDHRMPIPQPVLVLSREAFPLRHVVLGTHWSDLLDGQARGVDQQLDDLGVPASASVRDCGRAMREAGKQVRNDVLARAVKSRKLRLDITTEGDR
jgi:hypothetical protein